ncbi:alanine--glyoxylate aminotransferase family protein [bacterium]|nr:alanine--glyoxylate aminotransferase family protein [bacterium]
MAKIRKEYLMAPGPTPVPAEVLAAGSLPVYHHRTPRFNAVVKKVSEQLKELFKTKNDVYMLTSSGTGAMEAAVVNITSPGDRVVVCQAGKFGERWAKIIQAYGIEPLILDKPYGDFFNPEDVEKVLNENSNIKAVFIQLSETSTGCVYDIEGIARAVAKTDAILVVDGISGLGATPFYMDKWGVDIMLTGSQKGLMLPPGLALISLSKKAWKLVEEAKSPNFYFDLKLAKKNLEKDTTPWTPATTLILELEKALEIILDEGVEEMWKRHEWLADATRSAIEGLGLEFFARRPGNVLTSVKVPAGVDGSKLVKTMRDKYGVTVAGGQGTMKGNMFRIAHLGYMDRFDTITAISALEMTLKDLGHNVNMGAGVKAAQEVLCKDPE